MKDAIPAAALAQHIAFLGKTGSGKTSTAKLAVEQILRTDPKARVCVLDPIKSDWWGLTSSSSGRDAGLPFHILGGPHGHLPLHDSAGAAIGELVGNGALPLSIIDMADFAPGGLQRFFNAFAPALLRKVRGVVYLVLEEAHEFAPKERAGHEGENMTLHFAKKLATAGRSKGIRLLLLTQRTQALHNALLGSCDTMVAHRLTAPADQKPVKDWLKGNMSGEIFGKVESSLASLRTGTGWICSGEAQIAELVTFPKIRTFDNSATPTGDERASKVKTAPVDQDKLRAIIGEAVQEAEANDPAKLKARIKELEAAAAKTPAPVQTMPSEDYLRNARAAGWREGRDAGATETRTMYGQRIRAFTDGLERLSAELLAPMPKFPPVEPAATAKLARAIEEFAPKVIARGTIEATEKRIREGQPADWTLARGPRAILTAMAQLSRRYGPHVFTPARIGVIAGYSPGSSTFREYMRQLVAARLVDRNSQGFQLHPDGDRQAGDVPELPTGAALVDYWERQVGRGQGAILRQVANSGGESAEVIAPRAGFSVTSSTWREYTRQLRALHLIEGRDTLTLGEALR